MSSRSSDHIHQSVDHLFRHRAGQMIATLTRIFGIKRLDQVEDAVQDAMARALRLWPYQGAPDNPTAWLIQVAKNRMLDQLRRESRLTETTDDVEIPIGGEADAVFASEIRDKIIYLMFNEGYSALEGEELVRTDLCHEAIRLCELLAGHPVTGAPKVHALGALLLFQGARLPARCDAAGELLLLSEQDRSLWDRSMIGRGLRHLRRSASGDEVSDYHLEAEIAACHALAQSFEETDWPRVLDCYEELLNRKPSPVVALNRIVALAKVDGVEAGLAELNKLSEDRTLRNYYPFYATRGELLREAGNKSETIESYQKALGLTSSEPVRRFLMKRITGL